MNQDIDIFYDLEKSTYLNGLGLLFLEYFKIIIFFGLVLVVPQYLAQFFIEYDISSGQRIALIIFSLLFWLISFIQILFLLCFSLYSFCKWANK